MSARGRVGRTVGALALATVVAAGAGAAGAPAAWASGSLVSWGQDSDRQVSDTPTGTDFVAVDASRWHAMALRSNGNLVSWGYEGPGLVSDTPTGTFAAMAAGHFHSLALRSDGRLVSWGLDSSGEVSDTPTGAGFAAVAAGEGHSVALRSSGSLESWGLDFYGQVSDTPTDDDFVAVAAGAHFSVALRSDGTIVAWGRNLYGEVSGAPADSGFVAVAAGDFHGVALRGDGSLVSWGQDVDGLVSNTPAGTGFLTVAGGNSHSVAVRSDGRLVSWGANGPGVVTSTPAGTGFEAVAAGIGFSVAIKPPPAPPVVTGSDPVSPANNNAPQIKGTAEAGSTVRLYTNATCNSSDPVVGSATDFATLGLTVSVADDSATTFYATATDVAGNVSDCSSVGLTYVEDSTAPTAPVVAGSDPVSPANNNAPRIRGFAEPGSTVRLYTNASCNSSNPVVGSAAIFAPPGLGLTVSVADDSSTTFYATGTDAAGNRSACSPAGLTYVEDSTAPAAPAVTGSVPGSPANNNAPRIKGTAEAGSTVRLYTNAECNSTDPVVGSASDFAALGLTVTVANDSSTTFYATATDAAGNRSACSAAGLTYVEDSTPPDTVIDNGPAAGSTTSLTTATFIFHATEPNSTLSCQLDGGPVQACDSGTKTYTGLAHGVRTFSVVATDAAGNTDPSAATRTWTVNTPPVAVDDAYSVIGGATLSVVAPGVLGNDSDADNDPLTAQLVNGPASGLTLNANGSFTFAPGDDTAGGTVTFTYRASDGIETSNVATVTITLTAGCDGVRATRVGTAGNDTLSGTGGNDVIVGLGGNDTIDAGSGNDRVCGGSGNDTIELGSGNDRASGGTGNDHLRGGSGDDTLRGDDGDDMLDGGGDRDALFGDAGVDRLLGGGDNDALDGGSGTPDRCDGEGGSDTATACEQLTSVP